MHARPAGDGRCCARRLEAKAGLDDYRRLRGSSHHGDDPSGALASVIKS